MPLKLKIIKILFVCTNKYYNFVIMDNKESRYCGCLYYSANALARIMTRMADEAFSVTGLTSSYAFLIMTVNAKPGIQPNEISQQMMLSPSTVTRLIEKMEYRHLLERRTHGRITEVYPTAEGLKMERPIKEAWKGLKVRYEKILGKEKATQITLEVYESVIKLNHLVA
jgi:DNA-binding MarR family transcriptional regulator